MPQFDFAIVGRGLMGAAAARHLSSLAPRVALIGPGEPEDRKKHRGVFASHYDEGRITRTIDPDLTWAKLANGAISRYRAIEAQSGVSFYSEAGCVIAALDTDKARALVTDSRTIAEHFALNVDNYDGEGLADRFPYLDFGSDAIGIFEKDGAGTVSPRRLVAAQSRAAGLNGAEVIEQAVRHVRHRSDHAEIELESGDRITAAKALIATGGFSIRKGLTPDPLDISVHARTVTLFELAERDLKRLRDMPAIIYETGVIDEHYYMLPPVRYPDGVMRLKIGTEMDEGSFDDERQVMDWFRTDGSPQASENNIAQLRRALPDLKEKAIMTLPCVTTHTPTGYPAIGWSDSRFIGVLTGGCGSSAKSSDEIGRLGAMLLMHGSLEGQGYSADFTPRFR